MRFAVRLLLITLVVLWTTIRHDASHACTAFLEGAEIHGVRLFPGIHDELGFYFGYVEHAGDVTWLTDAAPFIADVLLLGLATFLLWNLPRGSKWLFYVLIFAIVSPLADIIYGYQSGLWRGGTDVADLLTQIPSPPVHLFFMAAIVFGVYLLRIAHRGKFIQEAATFPN